MSTYRKKLAAAVAASLLATMTACGGAPLGADPEATIDPDAAPTGELRVLCYDCTDDDNAFQIGADVMRDKYPDLDITIESTSFQQLTTNAQLLFQSSDAPDVALYNQGTATVGNLAATGVITDLTNAAEAYGWDEILPPSMQTISKYDPASGMMSNDGDWYGLSVQGEYAGLTYYNEDLFAEHGIAIPTTFDELEVAMQAFADAGIAPLATEGAETATQHIWYQLALSQLEDRQWINDYQLYENGVDWGTDPIVWATDKFAEWVEAGYIPATSAGLNAEEMVTGFLAGSSPIMISGSWWFNRVNTDSNFEWSVARFPGSTYSLGATGKLWVVPEAASNKTAAYAFLDTILNDPAVQARIGSTGGLAYNTPDGAIEDPMIQQFQSVFDELLEDDGISLYPDWPSPGLFDQLNSTLQGLINQNLTPEEARLQLQAEYEAGKEDLGI